MAEVRIWEESVTIPTYEVGAPDKNPMFLESRVYQGSSGKIYPYPTTQEISKEKTDKVWNAVFLENQYIKIMILPELGGRIQRAYDKTNNYDFVYYNRVIKPALVGLLGPWISGGIEFNWPQHHRPTTYMPVDYVLKENSNGSKSLLISDVDQMNGTKEITTLTLYPDKAYIEVQGQLYNRTPMPQTFLWWANPAVVVNDYTQSIFPPDVHNVYDHGKRAVSRFPIATGEYYKHDYSEGVDISRYKNIPVPTSYMAEKSDYDFVGGYDYSKQAGLLHVADHHVSTGKKQWTWGCGDFGKAWDKNLTDEDGPYIELMTGVYCDNQPDFTWLKPFEEKVFKQYFMPYKAVGQVKNATINTMLNMEITDKGLYVCVYATSLFENASLVVVYDEKEVYRESIKISPVDIYENELELKLLDQFKVKISIFDGKKELVSYQPVDQGIPEIGKPAPVPEEPEKIQSIEELYLIAQHIEQYRHATWLPDSYYLEGLKRDPADIRLNNAYGMLLLRRGLFEEAEEYFKKSIERLTKYHPNPYFGEPFYNLGLSQFYQEKYDDAYDAFFKATWTNEEQEMSFYYLAAIDSRRGNYESALEFIEKALVKNSHNIKGRGLKANILLALGLKEQARTWIVENLMVDQFDYVSMFTAVFMDDMKVEEVLGLNRNFHETFLQVARDLGESGLYESAIKVLELFDGKKPLIEYYKSYYFAKLGKKDEAEASNKNARIMDPTYTFPNKLEDQKVLEFAVASFEDDPKAKYYLANLLYDKRQFEKAIVLWEQSVEIDDKYPTALRNLAIAYYNKADKKVEAGKLLEKAFAQDEEDARVFLELDQIHKMLGWDAKERLIEFEKHINLAKSRDDLYTEYVTVLNLAEKYNEAYDAIMSHHFATWEGAEGKITTQFKVALVEMAKNAYYAADYVKAKTLLEEALSYPVNLGEGKLEGTKDNDIYYLLGLTCEQLREEAQDKFKLATLGAIEPTGMMYYYDQPAEMILYQGKALEKLGEKAKANARFYKLIDYGEHHIRDKFKMDYFAVSMPDFSIFDMDMDKKNIAHCHYLMGLGKLGLGRSTEAIVDFEKTLEIDKNHQNARIYLKLAQDK